MGARMPTNLTTKQAQVVEDSLRLEDRHRECWVLNMESIKEVLPVGYRMVK